MNPREVILRVLADYELHPGDVDRLLDALCPPGGRVVVSRESKPCEPCGGAGQWYHQDTYDAVSCESCGGSGVVEATTIHGLAVEHWRWQDGAPVFRLVDPDSRVINGVRVGPDHELPGGPPAVALPEDGE